MSCFKVVSRTKKQLQKVWYLSIVILLIKRDHCIHI